LCANGAFAQGVVSGNATTKPRPRFSGLPFEARFTDVAAQAGLTAKSTYGDPLKKRYIIEANGAGVAFLDYDSDGRLDIFTVNGSSTSLPPNSPKPTSHLYRNEGGGRFKDVTAAAGVARNGWGSGVCRGDYDNDGRDDLYVTYWGPNALYRNAANGGFEEMAAKAGVAGPTEEWSTGCTFVDADRDGWLDLLVTSYVQFSLARAPQPGQFAYCMFKNAPVYCGPRGLGHGTITLYRNLGNGRFADVSAPSGMRKATGFYAFTAAAADLNGDGWQDIYVAADSTPSMLFRNNRDGTFREVGTESGVAFNEHGAEQAGMGIAIADYNNDGWLDITKTNFIRDYPNLYRNLGKGLFEDAAIPAGLGVNPQYVLWGAGLEDFDNDGWRDLFQVAGHVYPEIQTTDPTEPYRNPRLLYRNLGNGKFEDVSHLAGAGIAATHSSRGAAFGDFDNDGDIDVLVMNMDEPPSLLRDDLPAKNRWVKVKLQGKSAIGSSVTITAAGKQQTAVLLSQSSFLSVNDPRLHFGLGKVESVDKLVVRWASGITEEFPGGPANSLLLLIEGSGKTVTAELPK
jgi:hypothetical protein